MKTKTFILKIIFIFSIGLIAVSSCKKEIEPSVDLNQSTNPTQLNGGAPGIIHTFHDGKDPSNAYLFGCKGTPTNCFADYEVTGSASVNLGDIIPQLDGSLSSSDLATIVSNNYKDLKLFANSAYLDLVINEQYSLEVQSDGDIHYFIFPDISSGLIIAVYPVKI